LTNYLALQKYVSDSAYKRRKPAIGEYLLIGVQKVVTANIFNSIGQFYKHNLVVLSTKASTLPGEAPLMSAGLFAGAVDDEGGPAFLAGDSATAECSTFGFE